VGFKVCIVDDQIPMRKALRRVLQSDRNFEVIEFASAGETIEFLKKHHVDIVVSDIYLGQGSGFDILRYIRGRAILADLPVIFVTGEGTKDDIVHSIDTGVNDYLLKPFETSELLNKVRTTLDKFMNPGQREQIVRQAEAELLDGNTRKASVLFHEAADRLADEMDGQRSPRVEVGLARLALADGDSGEALKILRRTVADFPLYFAAYSLLVDILLSKQRIVEATSFLQKELEINGKNIERRQLLAELYAQDGRHDKALPHLRQALVDNPMEEGLLLKMANLYREIADKDKAIHYFLKTRRVAKRSRAALQGILEVCFETSDFKKALHLMTDQITLNRAATEVYLYRAKVHERMENFDAAVADVKKHLESETPDSIDLEAHRFKARLLAKAGRIEEQCETLAFICTREPMPENEGRAGLAHLKCNRFAEAVHHYTRAVKMDPQNLNFRFNLAYALEQIGQFDRAKAMLQTIVKVDPEHHDALEFLNRLAG
jgi:DNA-binding NarL/FixJ family response regulator/Tfp pilus assembly protein PilF